AKPALTTIAGLQRQLDTFVASYNFERPHRSLPHRATPHTAYTTRPKATPTGTHNPHLRVRRDRINTGNVTLRIGGQLHHIGLGRTLDRTPVIMLIDHPDAPVHQTTPPPPTAPNRLYHGTGTPTGGPKQPPKTNDPNP